MTRYIISRLLSALLVIWLISIGVFLLMRVGPGDPSVSQQGLNATPASVEALRREMGLDKSYPEQYWLWMERVLTADPGRSAVTYTSVASEFRSRFPVTLELLVLTVGLTVLIGIPLGVISATRRNSVLDYIVRLFAVLGLAVPNFWIATLVLLIPLQLWGYSPPLDNESSLLSDPIENLQRFGPAAAVLSLGSIATVLRLTRSSLLEVMMSDYVRTARAKGLSERAVVVAHALRNSILPVLTVLGLLVGTLLGGSVIIESIFNLRGLGQYIYQSLLQKDYNVAQTAVLYTAAAVILLNLVVDLLYGVIDPRISVGGASNG